MGAAMNELMVELGAMRQRFETIKADRDEWKRLYHALEESIEANIDKMDAGIIEARAERDTLKARCEKLGEVCRLALLFHSGSPWDNEKNEAWANGLTNILGPAIARDCKVVGANGDGTWDGALPTNEATTKNLCNAIRAACGLDELRKQGEEKSR